MVAQYTTIKTTSHKKKLNYCKCVVTGELTKFVRRRTNCILGNTKLNWSRHISTTCIGPYLLFFSLTFSYSITQLTDN